MDRRLCRTLVTRVGLAASLLLGPMAVRAQVAPLMTVVVRPGAMSEELGRGDLDVTMTIPGVDVAAGAPLLRMGMFVPGLARPQVLGRLDVRDAAGAVPVAAGGGQEGVGTWVSTRAVKGDLVVDYRLIAENIPAVAGGPPIGVRIDGDAVSAAGDAMLMTPSVTGPYRLALRWDLSAMGPGAEAVSSFGDGDVTLPAGPVDRLGDALYMAGHLEREPSAPSGAFSAVWAAGEPPFDPRPAMRWTAELHAAMSRFFSDETEPPYRVFLRHNPMNAGGGAALWHSFIVTYGTGVTGESLKSILGHEMTHTWTANGIGQWYSEGNAVFYQALLPWRAGLMTADEYLADLNRTASRYYTNALRDTPEDSVAPHFWEDTRIRVLPYDRGAMYFAVLNGKIRRASGGARSVDDLVRTMVARARAGERMTEAAWLDLLRAEIGDDGPAVHRSMMSGGLMLPESEDFGPCFRRTIRKIRRFDLGFDNASLLGAEKIVRGLRPGSEAARAGLRDGDRITYAVALDAVQADVTRMLELQVTREGRTFPLTYLPRGDAVDAYQWARASGAAEGACTP